MNRTGNTIGAEGRRQHNENDPSHGDRKRRQERLAEREIQEGLDEMLEERSGAERDAGDGTDSDEVTDPEGVKPVTEERIEEADPARE